jgi:hypothetical protein
LSNINNYTPFNTLHGESLNEGIYSLSENNNSYFEGNTKNRKLTRTFEMRKIVNEEISKQKKYRNKVTFEPNYDKIILIYGLSFYHNNNIKNDVWWSSNELNKMRELVTSEVMYLRNMHPNWSISHCIREICKK